MWLGLATSLTFGVLMLASVWVYVQYSWSQPRRSRYGYVAIHWGAVWYGYGGLVGVPTAPWNGLGAGTNPQPALRWTPHVASGLGDVTIVPLWFVLVPLVGLSALAWRKTSRPEPWCCRGCGFDLRGLDVATCPECGRLVQDVARCDVEPAES